MLVLPNFFFFFLKVREGRRVSGKQKKEKKFTLSHFVTADVEPLVNTRVDGVVLGADLFRSETLSNRLLLSRRAVLVSSTDEQRVPTDATAVPSVHVGAEDAADDVPEVGNVVDVWKGARD